MKRNVLLALLFLVCQSLSAQTYSVILGRPTASSVTASVLFSQDVLWFLEYGTQPGVYGQESDVVTATANRPDELDLQGLLPDTKYYYRLKYKTPGAVSWLASSSYGFHTQRSRGSTFTFTIESDEHLYDIKGSKGLYQVCLNNQAADRPDFMLSLGDIFGDDHYPGSITTAEVEMLHRNYRPLLGSICHSVPFYVCLGNHEGENDYFYSQNPPENLAVWSTRWRKYYYPNPFPNDFYSGNTASEPYGIGMPENYYAWTWGDALFVVLDVYRDQCDTSAKPLQWDWTLGKQQYDWLKKTLEENRSMYKFVFAHHIRGQGRGGIADAGQFEWGGYEPNGTNYTFPAKRPGWAKPVQQLFADNSVTIFFQGHDHLYAREELDGIIYQAVPMPSDSTYNLGAIANADAYSGQVLNGSGHLRVTVSPQGVKVDFVRAYLPADTLGGGNRNGEVASSYTVRPASAGSQGNDTAGLLVRIFPHPVKGMLHLYFTEPALSFRADLFNETGAVVMRSSSADVDVSSLPNGFYFVRITAGRRSVIKKIIIIN